MRRKSSLRSVLPAIVLSVVLTSQTAHALPFTVDGTAIPIGGGLFSYQFSITNSGLQDVVIVSITDAPLSDPFIDPTLTAPPGFLASYDSGLGFVDFLGDTDSFAAGTTKGIFSFNSAVAPGPGVFSTFEALTDTGDLITGDIQAQAVPEPATLTLLALGLASLTLAAKRKKNRTKAPRYLANLLALWGLIAFSAVCAWASSHSDAPLIKQDPQANLTDVYAFIGTRYDNPNQRVLNVLVSVRPFSEAGDGVLFERFADDALYSIHITDPATGVTRDRYDFRFSSATGGLKNPNTILSYGLGTEAGSIATIGDARQNFTQTFSVTRNNSALGSGILVPPPNVGLRTTPGYNDNTTGKAVSGATTLTELDSLTRQGIRDLPGGLAVWAGPRDDGFYADTPAIFDLLDPRFIADRDGNPSTGGLGQDGGGVDGFQGYNVLSYGIQIPVTALTAGSYTDPVISSPATGVGVYASVSRQRITLRVSDGSPVSSGPWIQVNRLGNPLFNEVLVALQDKDKYNRTSPPADAQFATYALNPEPAKLVNLVLFGDPNGSGPLPASGRTDLAAIFIPDVIRVDTTTAPVRLPGERGFSRLGILGSDITTGTGGTRGAGWPNGRRIGDDVVDIALTAFSRFSFDIGDNVNANDQVYNQVFPYLATPHAGPSVSQRQSP